MGYFLVNYELCFCKLWDFLVNYGLYFDKLWDIFEYFWVDYELWQCRPLDTPPVMYRLGTCLL